MNSITIYGRLTKDVEIRTAGETNIASFSVASNGNKKDDVSYFDCKAFKGRADAIAKYFKKGDPIVIYGQMHQYAWQKQDGTQARGWEVLVNEFDFASSGKREASENTEQQQMAVEQEAGPLPF